MIFKGKDKLAPVVTEDYCISAAWKGMDCKLSITNLLGKPLHLHKTAVLTMKMPYGGDTQVYGEGYNKLSQYSGTVRKIQMVGAYGDEAHYKLPVPDGYQQVYNMVLFYPQGQDALLMGFASCRRFSGEFWFNEEQLQAVLNLEGVEIAPGETMLLETFYAEAGEVSDLYDHFASAIQSNHPMLRAEEIPTGWCSWLVYGPNVTAQDIYDNLAAIKSRELDLKYIQLDDGYQPYMGDWLSATDAFEGGVEKLCLSIKAQGFEPAIWVAPFIAEEKSELFQSHPDWFVKDTSGRPLSSDKVSFGGWRCGPWYMLDGTHPQARDYLTCVFKTMREKWQVRYFKLDANMWGALPFGEHFEKNKTCIEAYRMGMDAILKGAGKDSFILGCNAPMWASLGLVHGMRITNDNSRSFEMFVNLAKECFPRNWQHNRLWTNDPDTILLHNRNKKMLDPAGNLMEVNSGLTRDEFLYNATYTLASGGMVLSSDNMTEFTDENVDILKKLLPSVGVAATFRANDYTVGRIKLEGEEIICVFNEEETERDFQIGLHKPSEVTDFWSGEELGIWEQPAHTVRLPGHCARAYRVRL